MAADRLTSQLQELSKIIGSLGLNIASAQKEFNADYLNNIRVLMEMLKGDGSTDWSPEQNEAMVEILKSLSPARYQFTETTIDFSADLAETRQKIISGGFSFTTKAVAVNAAMTMGYGHDYRASARITCVLHAYHDPTFGQKLIDRATNIRANNPQLPSPDTLDTTLINSVKEIFSGLKGELPEPGVGEGGTKPDEGGT